MKLFKAIKVGELGFWILHGSPKTNVKNVSKVISGELWVSKAIVKYSNYSYPDLNYDKIFLRSSTFIPSFRAFSKTACSSSAYPKCTKDLAAQAETK